MELTIPFEKFKSIPKEYFWRSLSYLVNAFLFLPNITLLMFIIYMGEHNFFSYDFINEGIFGMKLFFFTTTLFLLLSSIVLYSPIFFYFAKQTGHKIDSSSKIIIFIVTLITWVTIGFNISSGSDYGRAIFILTLCAIMAFHISILFFLKAKSQFISLLFVTTSIIFISVNFPTQASQAISIGLKSYGVGGNLPISIKNSQSGAITNGKLKLITPKNIYFSPDNIAGIATYSLNSVSYYIVDEN